jgi:hypothetical protein
MIILGSTEGFYSGVPLTITGARAEGKRRESCISSSLKKPGF